MFSLKFVKFLKCQILTCLQIGYITNWKFFCSWMPDPYAKFVDAFSVEWLQFTCAYLSVCWGAALKTSARKGERNCDITIMDYTTMVHIIIENSCLSISHSSTMEETSSVTRKRKSSSPSRKQKTSADSLPGVRKMCRDRGFSSDATKIILASLQSGTKIQYKTYIKRWFSYCHKRQVDSVSPTLPLVIQFLTDQFQTGLGYSALNTARAALSSLNTKCIGH